NHEQTEADDWNVRQDVLERVHQMRKAMAVSNALFRRPKQRANIQRRHQPILGDHAHAEQGLPSMTLHR
ncbi:unnamed protein product, partial [Aphanomyces euteiches]